MLPRCDVVAASLGCLSLGHWDVNGRVVETTPLPRRDVNFVLKKKCEAVLLVVLMLASSNAPVGDAIWLNVPPTGTKCVSEEIQSNVVVLSDYVVVSDDHGHVPTISAKVTSPYGNNLHHKENVTHGQFAFTTQEAGNYLACFWTDSHTRGAGEVSVNIEWKTGIAAKDWESVARKEKIEGVELELRKLEGAVEAIHENLLYLRDRFTNLVLEVLLPKEEAYLKS
ncbi:hypothetical protein PVK06_013135 [Gossypium arboreum]|uniref:GOLD domain-containing protein n=1 Tax=Gossypium arboreum TaxID=29729 RepID=A0ABR0QDC8_GOSAR|nr:hypothetical protein PVK06_013135 [Gossypium arboreum]